MAVKEPIFAVDMTPMGVNLWQRGRSGDWLGLGFVPSNAGNFAQAVEDLRMRSSQNGRNSAEIRIAKSEVYFTKIKADMAPDKPTDEAILALVADRIPFRDKTARMAVDTCRRGSGNLAVAIVPITVLEAAAEFAKLHGFEPSYFTTLNNPMIFPSEPKFRLNEPARSLPALKPVPKSRTMLAISASVALAALGMFVVSEVLYPPSASGVVNVVDADLSPAPASMVLPQPQLKVPDVVATGTTGPTPDFAADIPAPKALPKAPLQIAVAPESAVPEIAASQPRAESAPVRILAGTNASDDSGFEPSGLAKQTRRLLNNSFISIEEPAEGQTGRKTIRILPSDPGKGSYNNRFDPRTFVRVAQAQTANDSSSGLPDVDNELLRITADGVPLFQGRPSAVPPQRPGTSPAASDDGLKAFSDSIVQVLDGQATAAAVDVSGIRIQKASLSTVRPRPNPRRKQEPAPAATFENSLPVKTASATTVRPKPRPASLARIAQQRDINAAAEQAAREAIRENMPTVNALFVSLLPKPRPDDIEKRIARTKPSLTTARTRSNAVVRTAPPGGGQSNGTMTTSSTPKSVAALATEKARISKNSLSLIGIFGTSSARRALLRLPTGRYIKVKQGDDVSGWKVSAIGESSVMIKKGSRDEVLRMPE